MSTKEKLLKAALKLFAKQGINKTSTAQVTRAVGVSEGALFVHFKTKQELIDTLYMEIKTASFAHLADTIDPAQSVEVNVKAIAQQIIEYFVSHYDEFVFIELMENDPQVSKATMKKAKELYAGVTNAVEGWRTAGELKQLDLAVLCGVLWSLMMMFIRQMKQQKAKKVDPAYLDIIWDAVKNNFLLLLLFL